MANTQKRKQLIEDILNSVHAMGYKIKPKSSNSTESEDTITHSQWLVLRIIGKRENTSIKDISEILDVSSSGATQLVDGLVKNGYVKRTEDPDDRRSVQLELSPKEKQKIKALKVKHLNKMAKLFDPLTDKELEIYLKLHKKITSNFLDTIKK